MRPGDKPVITGRGLLGMLPDETLAMLPSKTKRIVIDIDYKSVKVFYETNGTEDMVAIVDEALKNGAFTEAEDASIIGL